MTRSWRSLAVSSLILGIVLSPVAFAHADDRDGNLSVVITDGQTSSPSPSASRSAGSGAGIGTSGQGATPPGSGVPGTSGGSGVPAGGAPSDGAVAGEVSVAGMLYVGGLSSSSAVSIDPGEAAVTLWFTVRNASQSTIDATADFWMDSQLFGARIDAVDDVAITALLPGESRVVSTRLHHAGQWTLLDAHVTLTPPESIDGTALTPVTRDATVVVLPWLVALGAAVVLVAFFVFRVIRAAMLLSPQTAEAV